MELDLAGYVKTSKLLKRCNVEEKLAIDLKL